MRSFKAYAVKDDGSETYWDTIHSADEGRKIVSQIEKQGEGYTSVKFYDCLGGLALEKVIDYGE